MSEKKLQEREVADSAESTEPGGSADTGSSTARTSARAWQLRVARLLLAPVLAGAAVGVHFWINVPDGDVRVSNRDQGAAKRAKRRHHRSKVRAHRPRSDAQLAALQRRFAKRDFDDEPIVAAWARQAQTLINRAVVEARKVAFEGAPEDPRVVVTQTQCRTVRCRFILRSPYPHEITLLSDALERVQVDDEELWSSYEAHRIAPPDAGSPTSDHYLEVVVSMSSDDVESRSLTVAPATPSEEADVEPDAEPDSGEN